VAIFKAISEGNNKFSAIAVVGGKKGRIEGFCSPCGVCRQVMAEFCGKDFTIYMFDGKNEAAYSLEELLPKSFLL
jgi:cytidine deaminase